MCECVFICLDQGVSLNRELTISAGLASQLALGMDSVLLPPKYRNYRKPPTGPLNF